MLYPLRFKPIFRQYIWGGRRLESSLGKSIGPDGRYAESWEVVDHGEDQSVVEAGSMAGTTLSTIVRDYKEQLLGGQSHSQFPLLFKFLDANRDLSVQVHPNDAQAAKQTLPDLGKTEAWVILDAEPGSKVYAGLLDGIDRETLARHIQNGTAEECLHVMTPQAGDCIFIPAGTVHALGLVCSWRKFSRRAIRRSDCLIGIALVTTESLGNCMSTRHWK